MSEHSNLTILQHNVMKSRDKVMAAMLRDPNIWDYDILAIQEPWKNPYNSATHHSCKDRFHLAYPCATGAEPARVCFFINTWLSRAHWTFQEHTQDLVTLKVQYTEHNQTKKLYIHNIYREALRGDITETLDHLNSLINPDEQHLIVGDFNLHHPAWGGLAVKEDQQAEQLLTIMNEQQLSLLLPQGTVT